MTVTGWDGTPPGQPFCNGSTLISLNLVKVNFICPRLIVSLAAPCQPRFWCKYDIKLSFTREVPFRRIIFTWRVLTVNSATYSGDFLSAQVLQPTLAIWCDGFELMPKVFRNMELIVVLRIKVLWSCVLLLGPVWQSTCYLFTPASNFCLSDNCHKAN